MDDFALDKPLAKSSLDSTHANPTSTGSKKRWSDYVAFNSGVPAVPLSTLLCVGACYLRLRHCCIILLQWHKGVFPEETIAFAAESAPMLILVCSTRTVQVMLQMVFLSHQRSLVFSYGCQHAACGEFECCEEKWPRTQLSVTLYQDGKFGCASDLVLDEIGNFWRSKYTLGKCVL